MAVRRDSSPPAQAAGYCALVRGHSISGAAAPIGTADTQPSIESLRSIVIAGNRGFCNPNPAWQASADPPQWRRHRAQRY